MAEPHDTEPTGTLDDARLELRSVGYCVLCDAMVERGGDGTCSAGHPPAAISGQLLLIEGEPVPVLPRFNIAAFLLPFAWGPFHGQWIGIVFIPIWLFADSIVQTGIHGGPVARIAAAVVVALTLAFQYFFARKANGVAYRRMMSRVSVEQYVSRQRTWAVASVPAAIVLVGLAIWLDVAVGSGLAR